MQLVINKKKSPHTKQDPYFEFINAYSVMVSLPPIHTNRYGGMFISTLLSQCNRVNGRGNWGFDCIGIS